MQSSCFLVCFLIHKCENLQSFDDIVRDPCPKTTYDVAIFASDKWRKVIFALNLLFFKN